MHTAHLSTVSVPLKAHTFFKVWYVQILLLFLVSNFAECLSIFLYNVCVLAVKQTRKSYLVCFVGFKSSKCANSVSLFKANSRDISCGVLHKKVTNLLLYDIFRAFYDYCLLARQGINPECKKSNTMDLLWVSNTDLSLGL